MRTLNKARAVLLHQLNKTPETEEEGEERLLLDALGTDCKFAVNGLAAKLLSGAFTCYEEGECEQCTFKIGPNQIPIITTGTELQQDYGNLVHAIEANLPDNICYACENRVTVEREFGNYVFVEVRFNVIPYINNNMFDIYNVIFYFR